MVKAFVLLMVQSATLTYGLDVEWQEFINSKGSTYIQFRNKLVTENTNISTHIATTAKEQWLDEIINERKMYPDDFKNYENLVVEDLNRKNELSEREIHLVTSKQRHIAPLAYEILSNLNQKAITLDEKKRFALAVEEHFWKLANNEYEKYNTLVALTTLAQLDLLSRPIVDEIINVLKKTTSPRIAETGLRLLHINNHLVAPELINTVWQNHSASASVSKLCRALLNEHPLNHKTEAILEVMNRKQTQQFIQAVTNQYIPGRKILKSRKLPENKNIQTHNK